MVRGARAADATPMMWFFAILIVLALGGVAVVAAGRGRADGAGVRRPPDVAGARRRAGDAPTTCAGSGSRWPSAATGWPRSTPCSTGSPRSARREPSAERRAGPATGPRRRPTRRRRAHCCAVKPEYIVYVLTFLSAVVVVLTRLRLVQGRAARAAPGRAWARSTLHTACGVSRWSLWVVFLVTGDDNVAGSGSSRSFFYWLTAFAGLLILCAGCPAAASTRRAPPTTRWSEGPGLSVLAHVGMLVGVLRVHLVLSRPTADAPARLGLAPSPRPRGRGRCRLALLPARSSLPARGDGRRATRRVIGAGCIGHSVQGRPIVAWHLGEPGKPKVVLISVMHGNEPAPPADPAPTCATAQPVHGVNLWVVPVYNPDGLARHTRKNAHGVDLNRNYPYHWARPRRQLRVRPQAGLRARDPGDDAVPARGAARRTCCQLPPAAARRRHRHRAPGVRPAGGPRARPADDARSTAAASATAP